MRSRTSPPTPEPAPRGGGGYPRLRIRRPPPSRRAWRSRPGPRTRARQRPGPRGRSGDRGARQRSGQGGRPGHARAAAARDVAARPPSSPRHSLRAPADRRHPRPSSPPSWDACPWTPRAAADGGGHTAVVTTSCAPRRNTMAATGLLRSAGIEARRRRHQRARVRLGFRVVYGGEGCAARRGTRRAQPTADGRSLPSCPCCCGPACRPACRPARAASAAPACAHGSRAPGATSAAAGGKAQGGGREHRSGDSTPRPKMRSGDSAAGISIPCCLTQGHFRLFTAT
ncbi:hypothetical protein PVAP13_2NG406203 [Panicum virgatum]|uniref:Uncharacterized protein n=1 Tax=Panicum virgatum TaxID=38727 RepID=A0A8T0VGM7_PANVG|nr:hypothetical protein PVAP13_2NG406203 [Panicum virgatum]